MRRRATTAAALALVTVALPALRSSAAFGSAPTCNPVDAPATGPRIVHESLLFNRFQQSFDVLLPSRYQTSGRRYPVLYLLHGGTGQNHDSWLDHTDLVRFTATLPDEDQAIIVMPEAGYAGLHADYPDGVHLFETFHTQVLVPYVDGQYRTLADRGHRAVAGLSAGATGAAAYASRHPDLFVVVGGFSGAYALADPEIHALIAASVVDMTKCSEGVDAVTAATMASAFATDEVHVRDASPADLARNLRGETVFLTSGDGVACDAADAADLASGTGVGAIEAVLHKQTVEFDDALTQVGVAHHSQLRCGIHTWRHWQDALHRYWPVMTEAFGTPPPTGFDLRRASSESSAWGWTFRADTRRSAEFLDVLGASRRGFGLRGSGLTSVTTAPIFKPDAFVTVTGAEPECARADIAGRVRLSVDLGPAHHHPQYTAASTALELRGSYFTTRVVRFTPMREHTTCL